MTLLLTALLLGLMGSLHCVGMCGPIAIALPLHGNNLIKKITGGSLYNLGRTLTYGIMGAIFGMLGQGLSMIGFQQKISVVMGSLMILTVIFPVFFRDRLGHSKTWNRFIGQLKTGMGKLFSIRSTKSLFFIGLLNGLLPCGLVYMAIAGAIGTGNVLQGSLFMVVFGLGTIPMLLAISLAGNMMTMTIRNRINKLIPFLVVLVGVFFILRGLSLGIPYLSPPKQKIEQKFEKSLEQNAHQLHMESKGDCCEPDTTIKSNQ